MSEKIQKYRFLKGFLPDTKTNRLVILTGARQTGKTTLSKLNYPDLRYINLDAPENRESLRAVSSASWSKDVGNAIIDEAQKEPVVFEKIKYSYDEKGISFSLMLGSSQILLLKKIRESLAGRAWIYELWPLLMSEIYRGSSGIDPKRPLIDRFFSEDGFSSVLKSVKGVLIDKDYLSHCEAEDYLLRWGGMPALLQLSDEEKWKWLKDYEYTYLERDLSDLARLDDLEPFRKFQRLSALRSGNLLNYSEIARDASVSVDTAKRYMEYLDLSYQVILLQPYYKNITSSVVKSPKLYWLDIGLLRQISSRREGLSGDIYETMVVSEIVKWIKTAQRDCNIYFYRTRSGLEVDIILETKKGIIGIEIKSRATIASKDSTSLRKIASAFGSKWRGGMVIYTGNAIEKISEPDIWCVPSRRLFIGD
ncbi:MAG: ATP-binding protein [Candidatus Omnitrophica bacterium]|nr:ATP-binding protein [Candidatus Omnitrophota bacterium]